MTENSSEATEPDQQTTAPVRVPNVSPGAISGLDHEVIGGAANDAYDAQAEDYDGDGDEPQHIDPENPEHVEAYVALAPEDRQDAVRAALTGEPDDDQAASAPRVEGTQAGADPASSLTGSGAPVGTAPDKGDPTNGALPGIDQVQGQEGVAVPGEAVNAETGEVTQPGEQLPTIEQEGGEVLAPPIPEDKTSVDSLLDWIGEAESDDEKRARAQAVMDAELEKPEDDRRSTLIAPVQKMLETPSE